MIQIRVQPNFPMLVGLIRFVSFVAVRVVSGFIEDHRHLSLNVQNIEFDFNVKFLTLMYP